MNPQVRKIVNQLTADKKKLSIMVGLLAVAMLMWGRLLLQKVPRTATAEPTAGLAVANPNGDPATGGVVIRPVVWIEPTTALKRDLFALDATDYPRVPNAEEPTVRVAKSQIESVDDKLAAQAVHEAASRLTLQSIIQGSRPRVMIDGQLFAVGQTVEGFTVTRIDQRYVVLSKEGIGVRLVMN